MSTKAHQSGNPFVGKPCPKQFRIATGMSHNRKIVTSKKKKTQKHCRNLDSATTVARLIMRRKATQHKYY